MSRWSGARLIADVAGAAVSEGFIHSCLARAASLAAEVVALIRALITAAAVAGFDETTLRSGPAGEKKYVHGAFTERYSASGWVRAAWRRCRTLGSCRFRGDRGLRPVPELLPPRGEHIAGNQACLSHCCGTMRTAPRATRARSGPCRRSGRCAASSSLARRPRAGPGRHPRRRPGTLEHEFRHAVLAGLASVPRVPGPKNSTKQKPGRELLEFCRDRRSDVLLFTEDTSVWPKKNISERGVRPLKTQQKISGRLASDDVTQNRLDIRGHIDTARKHGKNAMNVLHDLMLQAATARAASRNRQSQR